MNKVVGCENWDKVVKVVGEGEGLVRQAWVELGFEVYIGGIRRGRVA